MLVGQSGSNTFLTSKNGPEQVPAHKRWREFRFKLCLGAVLAQAAHEPCLFEFA